MCISQVPRIPVALAALFVRAGAKMTIPAAGSQLNPLIPDQHLGPQKHTEKQLRENGTRSDTCTKHCL